MDLIVFLLVGALAGYLGDKLLGGGGKGILVNLLVGIIGGMLGGAVFGSLFSGLPSIGAISLGGIITATLGSALFLWVLSLIKK